MISMTTPDEFIKRIFNKRLHSVCIAVLGKKQSGKTDFILHLMERLHALGLMDSFGSNMQMEAPFQVDFIDDFQTLKKRCQMLNPDPKKKGIKRYFYFGSEMGKWIPKDQAWRNVGFIEELQTIRKYGLSFAGDAIDRVDARVLNETHFDGCFKKYNVKNPTLAYYDNWQTGQRIFLRNIPRTNIVFDTWYSANFYMQPQLTDNAVIPLNTEHKIAKKYLETGSWKKAGVYTQEGKRAVLKVLKFHFDNCLPSLTEKKDVSTPIEAEITKVTPTVTE